MPQIEVVGEQRGVWVHRLWQGYRYKLYFTVNGEDDDFLL